MVSHFVLVKENLESDVYDFSTLQQFCDLCGFVMKKGQTICTDKYLRVDVDEIHFCKRDEYVYDHVAHVFAESEYATGQYNAATLLESFASFWGYKFAVASF